MLKKPFALTPIGSKNFLTKKQKGGVFSATLQIQDSKSKHFIFPTDLIIKPGNRCDWACINEPLKMLNATQMREKTTNFIDFLMVSAFHSDQFQWSRSDAVVTSPWEFTLGRGRHP